MKSRYVIFVIVNIVFLTGCYASSTVNSDTGDTDSESETLDYNALDSNTMGNTDTASSEIETEEILDDVDSDICNELILDECLEHESLCLPISAQQLFWTEELGALRYCEQDYIYLGCSTKENCATESVLLIDSTGICWEFGNGCVPQDDDYRKDNEGSHCVKPVRQLPCFENW